MIKIVTLADFHHPFGIPLREFEYLCTQWKPDVINLLGDILDLPYLSKYAEGERNIGQKLKKECKEVEDIIMRLKTASNASTINYFEGNHEYRIRKWLKKHPEMTGLVEIPDIMDMDGIGITWIPENKIVSFGSLHFMHGIYYNQYHAKKTLDVYQRNIRYGHTHDRQVFSYPVPYDDKDQRTAESVGCMCNVNPEYLRERPNRWVNGFHMAVVDDRKRIFHERFIRCTPHGHFNVLDFNI